jgi:site-specific recombinase XerD
MQMIEKLIGRAGWIKHYNAGPFLDERNHYLAYLQGIGQGSDRLRKINRLLLGIANQIDLTQNDFVDAVQLKQATESWAASIIPHACASTRQHEMRDFTHIGKRWLSFLGKWRSANLSHQLEEELGAFLAHLKNGRGYTEQTLKTRQYALRQFFIWLSAKGCSLAEVRPETIAAYFVEHKDRAWSRATIAAYTESLRSFFCFAEQRHWCVPGIKSAIQRPRIYALSGIPQGLAWKDVQNLIASVNTNRPSHIRDRAAILLLTVYGWRIGEATGLTLDDIDWQAERIYIKRLKRRTRQEYPLVPIVGDAILKYLKEVRSRAPYRHVFMTVTAPYRPCTIRGLGSCIARHIRALGLKLPRYGPHTLRHACAAHLLSQGFSLKEIGDHLGHESPCSTQIYAKVDDCGLRQVAEMNLGFGARYVDGPKIEVQREWVVDRLANLREVGNVSLGGVL